MKVIDFYGKRWIFFAISMTILVIGVVMSFLNGVQLDIQFKGGSMLKYSYKGKIDADKAADITTDLTKRADNM